VQRLGRGKAGHEIPNSKIQESVRGAEGIQGRLVVSRFYFFEIMFKAYLFGRFYIEILVIFQIYLGPNHHSEEQIALARIIRKVRFDISKQSTRTISYTVYICIDMCNYVLDTSTCCSDRVLSCFSCAF